MNEALASAPDTWNAYMGVLQVCSAIHGASLPEQACHCAVCFEPFESVHTPLVAMLLGICNSHRGSDLQICYACLERTRQDLGGWACVFCRRLRPVLGSRVALRAMACRATEVFLRAAAGGARGELAAADCVLQRVADELRDMQTQEVLRTRHVRFEVVAEVQGLWVGGASREGLAGSARRHAMLLNAWICHWLLRVDEGELFQQYVRAQRQRVQSWVSGEGAWVEFVNCGTEEHPISCFYRDEDGPICLHRAWVQGDARILHWDDAFLGSAA